jgi:peptidoglycan/xylan/chitin deacetylase (PgdA/CDA1 family)
MRICRTGWLRQGTAFRPKFCSALQEAFRARAISHSDDRILSTLCEIAGLLLQNGKASVKDEWTMADLIRHLGPDDEGSYTTWVVLNALWHDEQWVSPSTFRTRSLIMLRRIKLATLDLLKNSGLFELVANSSWRRQRLLILCYHGISLDDEHLWRPSLYMKSELLRRRLELIRAMHCSVLPLREALTRLHSRDLPPRSVAITFDDGTYDFYKQAYPLLKEYGFPVTVYQTTYYTDHEMPVFNMICSYMLWKRRGERLDKAQELGLSGRLDLSTELGRHRIVRGLVELSEQQKLSGWQKDDLARRLARILGVDYAELTAKRVLQLMNAKELAEVGRNGVDIQLHTHRHRTPVEEESFRREVTENRERIRALTGGEASHFCYPGGVYRKEFTGWLEQENIESATTCDGALVDQRDNPYLLPRFVDTSNRSEVEFESWLSGVGSLVAVRRAASQQYVVPKD